MNRIWDVPFGASKLQELREMSTGSIIAFVTSWTDSTIIIDKQYCQDGLFEYLTRFPGFIFQFIFKWDDKFCRITSGTDVKKTDTRIIFIEPGFRFDYITENLLNICEAIEDSRKTMEKFSV